MILRIADWIADRFAMVLIAGIALGLTGGILLCVLEPDKTHAQVSGPQALSFTYTDALGASDIAGAGVGFAAAGASAKAPGSCFLFFVTSNQHVYLLSDDAITWTAAPITSSTRLANSQCSVVPSSVALSPGTGQIATLAFAVTFAATFSAPSGWLYQATAAQGGEGGKWSAASAPTPPALQAPAAGACDSVSSFVAVDSANYLYLCVPAVGDTFKWMRFGPGVATW